MSREWPPLLVTAARAVFAAVLLNGRVAAYDYGVVGDIDFNGTNTYATLASTTGAAPNLVYTLTRSVWARNITIRAGKSVRMAGFIVNCSDRLTLEATAVLHDDGNAAVANTAGAALASSGTLRFIGSGAGAAGRSTTGAGTAGSVAPNSSNTGVWPSGMGTTPTGGAGGAVTGGAAGAGGTCTSAALAGLGNGCLTPAIFADYNIWGTSNAPYRLCCGAGGGAGGCNVGTGAAVSGGGGGGGGGGAVNAYEINNAGRITCRGGNGGNASGLVGDGKASGGGGGMGGQLYVRYCRAVGSGLGTVDAAGGAAGTGIGTGGTSGVDGSPGASLILQVTE